MISFAQRFTLPLAILSLALLAGCGNSNNVTVNNNGYTNSDFSGTYVFSFSGTDITAQSTSFFAIAGTITADGNGNITGGTVDINDLDLGGTGVFTAQALSASTYSVSSDGRGSGTLKTPQGNFGIDFVLTSDAGGLISRFDNSGSGSGTFAIQGSASQSQLTSLAFTLFGSDVNFNPVGTVGAVTLDGTTGAVTSGLEDFNDNGDSAAGSDLTISSGSLVLSSGTNGTATLTTSYVPSPLTFDVWVVDSTHLKLIETDTTSGLALVGDAFTQQPTFTAGQAVFTLAGTDTTEAPFVAGGYVTTDANGNLSAGLEDYNDAGNPNTVSPFTGSCNATAPFAGDRCQLTLTAFSNGTETNLTFAAYPSTGGVLLLEDDSFGSFLQGAAYSQSATAFAVPNPYGYNLTGFNAEGQAAGTDGEVDEIAQFNATTAATNNMTGVVDENDLAVQLTSSNLNGAYTPDSPVDGRGGISASASGIFVGTLNLEYYVIDSSTALVIDGDVNQAAMGVFALQSTPGGSVSKQAKASRAGSAAASITSLVRPFHKSRMAVKQRGK
ncbi:MAG: hypothetical protein WB817_13165 [Terriglobales bacterium]